MVVLDTSVLLALVYREPGHDTAADALATGVISSVNLAETATVLLRRGLGSPTIDETMQPFIDRSLPTDNQQALDAGLLHAMTRWAGLSLGDRFCLALARKLGAPILSADRAWTSIADQVGLTVPLLR